MSDHNKCRQISELLPPFFKSELTKEEAEAVESHLLQCQACRTEYAREKVLFALATSDLPSCGLDSHADSALLDQFVNDRDSLETAQRSEFEAHLAECQLCREAVEKLAALPSDLSGLTSTDQLPLISESDGLSLKTPSRSNITDLTKRVWRPFAAVAAAAVIVVVSMTLMTNDGTEPMARVEGTFPAVTRNVSTPTVFECNTESFTFAGRVYVDPEENHDYSILIRDVALDSLIFHVANLITFDSLGFATVELIMSPGLYELVLYDIVESDSITIPRPFEIRRKS